MELIQQNNFTLRTKSIQRNDFDFNCEEWEWPSGVWLYAG